MDLPPCDNCITMPICRHKRYYQLFDDCQLLQKYEADFIQSTQYPGIRLGISKIESVLKPTKWEYVIRHDSVIRIG